MKTKDIIERFQSGRYNWHGVSKKEFIHGLVINFGITYSSAYYIAKKLGF